MIFSQQRHKVGTRKIMRASRRPGIVIKFWRQIVGDADPRHDVTKSRRRERSRRFVSSLLIIVRRRRRRRRRRAVAPTSNTASHDYHEKIS